MLDEPLKYLEELFNYVLIKKNHFYQSTCLLSAFINDDKTIIIIMNIFYEWKNYIRRVRTGQVEINLDCICGTSNRTWDT